MAIDRLNLGSGPSDEECAQLGEEGYELKARAECNAYIAFLQRAYLEKFKISMPENLDLRIKSYSHDFGVYYDVVAMFDDTDDRAVCAAYWCEGESPTKWDEQAKKVLGLK